MSRPPIPSLVRSSGLYGVNIDRGLAERLRTFCSQTDRVISATVERAIEEFLTRNGSFAEPVLPTAGTITGSPGETVTRSPETVSGGQA